MQRLALGHQEFSKVIRNNCINDLNTVNKMKINYFNDNITMPSFDKTKVNGIIETILIENDMVRNEMNIIFMDDKELLKINKEYLNHNTYTDIISFDYKEEAFAELYISTERTEENEKLSNSKNELIRVIFHGVLHIAGFNDKNNEEQKEMRTMEDKYLTMFHKEHNN